MDIKNTIKDLAKKTVLPLVTAGAMMLSPLSAKALHPNDEKEFGRYSSTYQKLVKLTNEWWGADSNTRKKIEREARATRDLTRNGIFLECDYNGTNKVKENRWTIINKAGDYGVDPRVLAGVVYAENSLNVDWVDATTDWTGFWGVDTSIGLGQVKMSTADFLEDRGYVTRVEDLPIGYYELFGMPVRSSNALREKLLEESWGNLQYAAAYIKYFEDTWEQKFPEIENRPDILGTLYNLGHGKEPNSNPKPNLFGQYVQYNYDYMDELLND